MGAKSDEWKVQKIVRYIISTSTKNRTSMEVRLETVAGINLGIEKSSVCYIGSGFVASNFRKIVDSNFKRRSRQSKGETKGRYAAVFLKIKDIPARLVQQTVGI